MNLHTHQFANAAGCQWRHRLVMMYALARRLRTDEHVHHLNGVDNDRSENLELLIAEYHGSLHATLEAVGRCAETGRFIENRMPRTLAEAVEWASRRGPVISRRDIDPVDWLPAARLLK